MSKYIPITIGGIIAVIGIVLGGKVISIGSSLMSRLPLEVAYLYEIVGVAIASFAVITLIPLMYTNYHSEKESESL